MPQTETLQRQKSSETPIIRKAKIAGAIGIAAAAGIVGINKMNNEPSIPNPNQPHRVYTVKPGDTAWGISEKASPNSDPRDLADMITKETNDSTLQPGEKISLPDNSQVGVEVAESSSKG